MNKITALLLATALATASAKAQFIRIAPGGDTTASLSIEGYIDAYFSFDSNQPKEATRPYFVSQNRHNEFNINMACLSMKYSSDRVRATFTPGFGTYMNANYAAERMTLRNIMEANVGVRLFRNRNIWLDAGVIGSPYTNETAISFDQMLYTRSFAPEYVPYYLTGAKLSVPISPKINMYLYLLNGWQQIEDVNTPLAMGTQIEYKPTDRWLLNWNTYLGNEESAAAPDNQMRYFTDIYATWRPDDKLSIAACAYAGLQKRRTEDGGTTSLAWWQANMAAQYQLGKQGSLSARAEYFSDPHSIMIVPVTDANGFDCSSFSLCYNHHVTRNVLFRIEARQFISGRNIFRDADQQPVNKDFTITGGLSARF